MMGYFILAVLVLGPTLFGVLALRARDAARAEARRAEARYRRALENARLARLEGFAHGLRLSGADAEIEGDQVVIRDLVIPDDRLQW